MKQRKKNIKERLDWVAWSVIGPAHKELNIPNQDAFRIYSDGKFCLAVVCDGIGSSKFGGKGAELAIKAIIEAVCYWRGAETTDISILLKMISLFWKAKVPKNNYTDYNTTCLFVLLEEQGKCICAQLGDGVIILNLEKEKSIISSDMEFGNITTGIGNLNKISDWKVFEFEFNRKTDSVLLATDGISEDINEGDEYHFVKELRAKLSKTKKRNRYKYLHELLTDWPTPYHSDDKTICLIWHK